MVEKFNFSTFRKKYKKTVIELEVWATNFVKKDKMTGRVDKLWRIFKENCNNIKIEVTGPK